MKRVVALVQLTDEQEKVFIEYIKSNGWGFWHWVSGSWLLQVPDGIDNNPALIRDKLCEINKSEYSVVFEVTGVKRNYAGFGPQAESNNMFKWVLDNWLDK